MSLPKWTTEPFISVTVQVISRRERKKLAVREKIQDELVSLISLKGLENTTIDDPCEAADIAKKTFYAGRL